MTTTKYFADINGVAHLLSNIHHDGHISAHVSHFTGLTEDGRRVTATRAIAYRTRPSMHECDVRCQSAKGRTMTCECACGGRNHGKIG